jgi:hypothetical protein
MNRKLLLILFFLISSNIFAQACGGGIFTINFYVPNGTEVRKFHYEIFPVTKEFITQHYSRDYNNNGGILWDLMESELEAVDPDEKFEAVLKRAKTKKTGTFKSKLQFHTLETQDYPVVIKITSETDTLFLFGNFFGGCDNTSGVIWQGTNRYIYQ